VTLAVVLDAGDLHAEMDANAGRGGAAEEFRDFGRDRARHHARASSTTSTSSPLARAVAANSSR
jgi:hypothetical protein